MIRLLLLTFIPLLLPFAAWFVWRVFSGTPKIDPQTGDQIRAHVRDGGDVSAVSAQVCGRTLQGYRRE